MRALRKSPGYAATAVITLVTGIGATTAIFSVVNTVLLRPLPYADPGRLVKVEENHDGTTNFSHANYLDLRATQPRSLARSEAYRPWTFNVSGGNTSGGAEPAQEEGAMISVGLFDALGVAPQLGRNFSEEEQHEGADHVAVLSYGLWQRQFGSDPGALGKTIRVSDVPHVIVGVMPPGFAFPQDASIWTPLTIDGELRKNRRAHLLKVIGRLAFRRVYPRKHNQN